ncbi:cytochrome c oxidase assembly protein [Kineococcus sp. SYSU DK005]|uniref:cytochrome c oxidase assembly protein n=1 Tax=Kineococcus sp. SYSU DK005 TaxID=3383126 RepID=UPI003D7CA88A
MSAQVGTGVDAGVDAVLLVLAVLVPGAYLAGEQRLHRRGDRWPVRRTAAALGAGAALAAAGLAPALAPGVLPAGGFRAHVVVHLLATMLAPLLLALAAPVTLALRALPLRARRALLGAVRGRWSRVVTWAPVVLALEAGGLAAFYLTPLFALAHERPWLGALVHAHTAAAAYLFSAVVAGADPLPHRPGVAARAVLLVVAAAVHDVVAKLLWARGVPAAPGHGGHAGGTADVRAGAELLHYGGTLVEVATAVALFGGWYAREGRRLRRERESVGAGLSAARRAGPAPAAGPRGR